MVLPGLPRSSGLPSALWHVALTSLNLAELLVAQIYPAYNMLVQIQKMCLGSSYAEQAQAIGALNVAISGRIERRSADTSYLASSRAPRVIVVPPECRRDAVQMHGRRDDDQDVEDLV